MTLSRRTFLKTSCGLGIGTAASGLGGLAQMAASAAQIVPADAPRDEYERILARTKAFRLLGHPRSWSIVRQGFLPISPERVMILESRASDSPSDCWGYYPDEEKCIYERFKAVDRSIGTSSRESHAACSGVSEGKVRLILRITRELTRHYCVPEYWQEWAYWMTVREAIQTTGGCNIAMPHDYQHHNAVDAVKTLNTMNAPVDWWLVLIPGGTQDWDTFDGLPVHMMLLHVLSRLPEEARGTFLRIMCLTQWSIRSLPTDASFVGELSKMDRVSAARLMSRHVVSQLWHVE